MSHSRSAFCAVHRHEGFLGLEPPEGGGMDFRRRSRSWASFQRCISKFVMPTAILVTVMGLTLPAPTEGRRLGEPTYLEYNAERRDRVPTVALQRPSEQEVNEVAPNVFAIPIETSIDSDADGVWQREADGRWTWTVAISAPGATDLNLALGEFAGAPGTRLYVIGEDDYVEGFYGPVDGGNSLWLPVTPGSLCVVHVESPAGMRGSTHLTIVQVGYGIRGLFQGASGRADSALRSQDCVFPGSCEIDVSCELSWQEEAAAVAMLTVSGSFYGTGTLIRDTDDSSVRPLLLTASHMQIDETTDASVVCYWRFESEICGERAGGTLSLSTSGSTLLAKRADVDFCLVELSESPPSVTGYLPYYSGWDRTGSAVVGAVTLHHPYATEKAISIDNDTLVADKPPPGVWGAGYLSSHWRVGAWDSGSTEPGSSGAGLWMSTERLCGWLTGGNACCEQPSGSDWFGRLSEAWDGVSAAERLKDWLDPLATGVSVLDGQWGPPPPPPPSPTEVWVDFGYTGNEVGTEAEPFNSIEEAVQEVAVQGLIRIRSGSTPEAVVIHKASTLVSEGGAAVIGQP